MDAALVLAGGESRRFGQPKALIDIGGKAMVRRVADAIAPLTAHLVVSVANAEMGARIRSVLPQASFAIDYRPGSGPIEGFRRGFEACQGERVLVAPCDAPLLRTELYRLLLESLGDHEAAVPRFDVLDPVRAVYRRNAVLRVLAASSDRLPSPSSLVDRLDAAFVGRERLRTVDPDLESFLDVNDPGDLATAAARLTSA